MLQTLLRPWHNVLAHHLALLCRCGSGTRSTIRAGSMREIGLIASDEKLPAQDGWGKSGSVSRAAEGDDLGLGGGAVVDLHGAGLLPCARGREGHADGAAGLRRQARAAG